jgi:2'-5' RNA ligase
MRSVRAFIAILPPPDVIAGVETLLRQLRSSDADFRWESAVKLHATVKFLGNVEESQLPVLYDEMGKSARGLGPFDVAFEHLGGFPDARHPRVVWLGCRDVSGSLGTYKQRLDDGFTSLGFEKDDHPFRPHITLGRAKSHRGVPHLLSLLENLTFEPRSASIDGIVVLKSVLQPQGAEYSLLHAIRLPPP